MTTTTSNPSAPTRRTLLFRAFSYYVAYIILGATAAAYGPTLPGLADQTGSVLSQISIIFTVNSLGYVIGSLIGGRLYDRFPGQPVMAGTLLLMALGLATIPFAPSLTTIIIAMLVAGFGMGTLNVGNNTLLVWMFGKDVGPYMNALHFCFGLGAFLSPILIDRIIVVTGGIAWAYWGMALLILPVAFWMTRIPSPSAPMKTAISRNHEDEKAFGVGLLTLMAAGLLFLHVGGELGFGGFIFSYGTEANLGDTTARLLNSTYWGALALGRLVAIPLAARLLPRTMLFLDYVGAALSLALVILLPGSSTALWIGTFGFGFSIASIYATVLNFTERRVMISGAITSYLLIGGNLGSMTIPWVIGQFFERSGPGSMMLIVALTIILSLVLLGIMLTNPRGQETST